MKLASALRSPYRSRAIVRSTAPARLSEATLAQAIALTQLILLALCAARVAADRLRGSLSTEGDIALALLVVLAASLVGKAID
jgi:hypothetical protein